MRISDWSSDVCSSDLLREEQYVGHHIIPLVREHLTGPTETGLGLVDDEEHAATLAMRLERFEIADGQIDDAAGTQHGLGDKRGEIARRLAIQPVEAVVPPLLPGPARGYMPNDIEIRRARCRAGGCRHV